MNKIFTRIAFTANEEFNGKILPQTVLISAIDAFNATARDTIGDGIIIKSFTMLDNGDVVGTVKTLPSKKGAQIGRILEQDHKVRFAPEVMANVDSSLTITEMTICQLKLDVLHTLEDNTMTDEIQGTKTKDMQDVDSYVDMPPINWRRLILALSICGGLLIAASLFLT